MGLETSPVNKSLDKRLKLLGYEIPDLLAIFLVLSLSNFLFSEITLFLVVAPAALLAGLLRLGKVGKPDNYLVHWIRFQVRPGIYSAFPEPTKRGRIHAR